MIKIMSMKTKKTVPSFFAVLALLVALLPGFAQAADTPAQTAVRHFYTQLVSAMKQGEQLGFAGRYKKLDPAIRSTFNLPVMTKMSVGSSWSSATPEQQKALIDAFSDFSVSSYASRFAAYDGEEFTVDGQKATDGGVIVETSLSPKEGDPVKLNYLMKPDDSGAYRVTDVFINGTISEMATRRAEFSSIARRDGIPALVNSLGEKSKQMGPS
jgi:phospholipid transport system substrate-binding protein